MKRPPNDVDDLISRIEKYSQVEDNKEASDVADMKEKSGNKSEASTSKRKWKDNQQGEKPVRIATRESLKFLKESIHKIMNKIKS